MHNITYINSQFVNFRDAKIHIEDRGLQFADSVYEVIAVVNKNLLDLRFHIKRLKYSLNELDIQYKFTEKNLLKIFKKLVDHNSIKNGIIYLQITRGVQKREHAFKRKLKPTVIIYTRKKTFNLPNKNFKGVSVITHEDYRWSRRDIKTTNLLPNILAENEAHKKKAYTAILIKNNKITEAAHANIWIVKNNIILTHPSNTEILKGVTRTVLKVIIKKFKLTLKEKSFTKKQLFNADEIFLTSSTSFVTPIIKVDSKLINKGKIGNITKYLAQSYFSHFK
jgi:D-alanine transaminase